MLDLFIVRIIRAVILTDFLRGFHFVTMLGVL